MVIFTISRYFDPLTDAKVLLEEGENSCDYALLFLCAIATAKASHRRHKLIYIRSSGLDRTVAECGFDELACFLFFEVFLGDYLLRIQ